MKKLDFSFRTNLAASQGCLLLSDPFTQDPYFTRSVILLCRHNEQETFGFVLTNHVEIDLNTLAKNLPNINAKVSIGGPVDENNLYFIHTLGDKIKGTQHIAGKLCFGGDSELLFRFLSENPKYISNVRFFIGYSGWDYKQLKEEMKENAWIAVNNIPESDLFTSSATDFWKACMIKQGVKFEMISKFPLNPNDN